MDDRRKTPQTPPTPRVPDPEEPLSEDEERVAKTEAFRVWLTKRVAMDRRSLHAIEEQAGIRGNGLGKFLRGERGGRHGLTPLMLRRLAPVLLIGEVELLARAGHLTYEPWQVPILEAIAADRNLDQDAKMILLVLHDRLVRSRPDGQ
jgi:hypothetical protein